MKRWGPVAIGVVLSLATSVGLSMVIGAEAVFPGVSFFMETPESFAGIDRDPNAPAPPPFEAPADTGSPTRVEILRQIRAREFAALTTTFEHKRARVVEDIRHEAEWHRVANAFNIDDPSITPLLDEWVAASPDSVGPYVARGIHSFTLAFAARGTKFASETSTEQMAGMRGHLEKVAGDALDVLERDPAEVLAYMLLIDTARAGGTQTECGDFARDGLTAAPASLSIRWALAMCRLPRWGGSAKSVTAIAEQARPFVVDNPDLAALGGIVAWDEGRTAKGEEASQLLGRAVAAGPHHAFFLARARHHHGNERHEDALADANLGLALSPQHPDLLEFQFRALAGLGRLREAIRTLDVLAEVDPTNTNIGAWRDWAAHATTRTAIGGDGGNDTGALRALLEIVQRDPTNFDAVLRIDHYLAQRGDWDRIIRHWDTYLLGRPDDGRAYLERAGANRHKGDLTAARADLDKGCTRGNQQACNIATQMGWR